jgi:hypothetical protein
MAVRGKRVKAFAKTAKRKALRGRPNAGMDAPATGKGRRLSKGIHN